MNQAKVTSYFAHVVLLTCMGGGISQPAFGKSGTAVAASRHAADMFREKVVALTCDELLAPQADEIVAMTKAIADKKKAAKPAEDANALLKMSEEMTRMTKALEVAKQSVVTLEKGTPSVVDRDTMQKAVEKASAAVKKAGDEIISLRSIWDSLGDYEDSINPEDFLKARRKVADCADRVFAVANANVAVTNTMSKDGPEDAGAKAALGAARTDYVYIAHEQNYDEAQLSLFTGPTLSLNGDDKFKTGFEVSALFDGGAGSFFKIGRVFTDFTYQTKGSVNVMAEADGSVAQPTANQLFRSDKGFLRFNVGASTGIGETNRYSIFVSAGLSTIPGVGGDFPQALRPRVAVGMLGRTFVSEGLYTRLSLSVAHDEYWRTATGSAPENIRTINSYERGVVEALVLIPQLNSSGVTLAARLGLDTPLDGKGPSEVRLSVLASANFGDFLQKIIKLTPAVPAAGK